MTSSSVSFSTKNPWEHAHEYKNDDTSVSGSCPKSSESMQSTEKMSDSVSELPPINPFKTLKERAIQRSLGKLDEKDVLEKHFIEVQNFFVKQYGCYFPNVFSFLSTKQRVDLAFLAILNSAIKKGQLADNQQKAHLLVEQWILLNNSETFDEAIREFFEKIQLNEADKNEFLGYLASRKEVLTIELSTTPGDCSVHMFSQKRAFELMFQIYNDLSMLLFPHIQKGPKEIRNTHQIFVNNIIIPNGDDPNLLQVMVQGRLGEWELQLSKDLMSTFHLSKSQIPYLEDISKDLQRKSSAQIDEVMQACLKFHQTFDARTKNIFGTITSIERLLYYMKARPLESLSAESCVLVNDYAQNMGRIGKATACEIAVQLKKFDTQEMSKKAGFVPREDAIKHLIGLYDLLAEFSVYFNEEKENIEHTASIEKRIKDHLRNISEELVPIASLLIEGMRKGQQKYTEERKKFCNSLFAIDHVEVMRGQQNGEKEFKLNDRNGNMRKYVRAFKSIIIERPRLFFVGKDKINDVDYINVIIDYSTIVDDHLSSSTYSSEWYRLDGVTFPPGRNDSFKMALDHFRGFRNATTILYGKLMPLLSLSAVRISSQEKEQVIQGPLWVKTMDRMGMRSLTKKAPKPEEKKLRKRGKKKSSSITVTKKGPSVPQRRSSQAFQNTAGAASLSLATAPIVSSAPSYTRTPQGKLMESMRTRLAEGYGISAVKVATPESMREKDLEPRNLTGHQQLYALDAFTNSAEMLGQCEDSGERELLLFEYFLWGRVEVEQGCLKAYQEKFPESDELFHDMNHFSHSLDLGFQSQWNQTMNDGTGRLRYPYNFHQGQGEIRSVSELIAGRQADVPKLIASHLKDSIRVQSKLSPAAQLDSGLDASIAEVEASLRKKAAEVGASRAPLTGRWAEMQAAVAAQKRKVQEAIANAERMPGPISDNQKNAHLALKNIVFHLNLLEKLPSLMVRFPQKAFLFNHGHAMSFLVQYILENLGLHLAFKKDLELYSHNLMSYQRCTNMCTEAEVPLLRTVNMKKGIEYPHFKFTTRGDEKIPKMMNFLNELYAHSKHAALEGEDIHLNMRGVRDIDVAGLQADLQNKFMEQIGLIGSLIDRHIVPAPAPTVI